MSSKVILSIMSRKLLQLLADSVSTSLPQDSLSIKLHQQLRAGRGGVEQSGQRLVLPRDRLGAELDKPLPFTHIQLYFYYRTGRIDKEVEEMVE